MEKRELSKLLSFALTGRFDSEEDYLMVDIYEIVGKSRKLIYETLPTAKSTALNNRSGLFFFEQIEINTDIFDNKVLRSIVLEFELKRVKYNKKQKESIKILGQETAKLRAIMDLTDAGQLQLNILKHKKKLRGTLNIGNTTIQPIFSFLDYKIYLDINVIPVIAIDYSLSNLTFDTKKELIHTLKKDEENDYISILNHIVKVYQNLTPFIMGYGMGGKTLPKQQNASDIFALSGNMFNPIVDKDEVYEKYAEVFNKIKVSLPINYTPVLDLVKKYAKYEQENYEARNFYSLIYITPGVVDDLDKALKAVENIGDLPMSVTVVKIKNDQLKDTNDPLQIEKELQPHFEKYNRKFFNLIDFEGYKQAHSLEKFEEDLIREIPDNVRQYMSDHNVFAYDLQGDNYETRITIKQKKEQIMENEGIEFFDEIVRRPSVVHFKEYLKELKKGKQHPEEEKKEEVVPQAYRTTKEKQPEKVERPCSGDLGSSSDDSQGTWSRGKRRLSYSNILEEEYIQNAPTDERYDKGYIESLVKSGRIFDESHAYLLHLLGTENEQGN